MERKKIINFLLLGLCTFSLFFFAFFYPFKNGNGEHKAGQSNNYEHKVKFIQKKKDFFAEYRMDREKLRSKQSTFLEEVIEDPALDPATKKDVNERLIKLNENREKELNIENMIKARGYEDAIAIVHDGCIDIIVKSRTLMAEDVATIGSIASKNTGIDLEHIVIMSKAG